MEKKCVITITINSNGNTTTHVESKGVPKEKILFALEQVKMELFKDNDYEVIKTKK